MTRFFLRESKKHGAKVDGRGRNNKYIDWMTPRKDINLISKDEI